MCLIYLCRSRSYLVWCVLAISPAYSGAMASRTDTSSTNPLDYYVLLGVERNADSDAIAKAARNLLAQHHPDRGGDEAKFKRINEAKQILGDPDARAKYDEALANAERQAKYHASRGQNPGPAYDGLRQNINAILEKFVARSLHHAEQLPRQVTVATAAGGAVVGVFQAVKDCPKDAGFGEILFRVLGGAFVGGAMGAVAPSALLAYSELPSEDQAAIRRLLGGSEE